MSNWALVRFMLFQQNYCFCFFLYGAYLIIINVNWRVLCRFWFWWIKEFVVDVLILFWDKRALYFCLRDVPYVLMLLVMMFLVINSEHMFSWRLDYYYSSKSKMVNTRKCNYQARLSKAVDEAPTSQTNMNCVRMRDCRFKSTPTWRP